MPNEEELGESGENRETNPDIDAAQKALDEIAEDRMTPEEKVQSEARAEGFELGQQAAAGKQEKPEVKPEAEVEEIDFEAEREKINQEYREHMIKLQKLAEDEFGRLSVYEDAVEEARKGEEGGNFSPKQRERALLLAGKEDLLRADRNEKLAKLAQKEEKANDDKLRRGVEGI